MKYRNNVIKFTPDKFYDLEIVSGQYTIDSFSISEGQDPDGKIQKDLVFTIDGNGELTFSIGREESTATAAWFNKRVPKFNGSTLETPKALYFSLSGTLSLSAQKSDETNTLIQLTIADFVIAMGSESLLGHSWWIGGSNCFYNDTYGDGVLADCIDQKNHHVKIILKHDKSENKVKLRELVSMSYHKNEVLIEPRKGGAYSLVKGQFTVLDHKITEDQDPLHYNFKGLSIPIDEGKLSFWCGRKESEDVANWFNSNLSADNNTFNKPAEKLNFAFMGTLELTLTGGIFGAAEQTFIFSNVMFAQGNAVFTNNWWFGGLECKYLDDHQVIAQCSSSLLNDMSFLYQRGGAGLSDAYKTVEFTPFQLLATEAWLGLIDSSTTFSNIIIPGSHDAGMSESHHCSLPIVVPNYAETQSQSIKQQLYSGSRYFDLRIDYDHDELVTYHRNSSGTGCNGQSLKSVMDQATQFLDNNTSEFAILKFSHIRKENPSNKSFTKMMIDDLCSGYSDYLYKNPDPDINLVDVTVGQLRGKLVLVFDYDDFISSGAGFFRYRDGTASKSGVNLTVFDEYSETASYVEMYQDQIGKLVKYGGLGRDYLFLLSWTLTPDSLSGVETLAGIANQYLPDTLYSELVLNEVNAPNIVFLDYLDQDLASAVILYNFI